MGPECPCFLHLQSQGNCRSEQSVLLAKEQREVVSLQLLLLWLVEVGCHLAVTFAWDAGVEPHSHLGALADGRWGWSVLPSTLRPQGNLKALKLTSTLRRTL